MKILRVLRRRKIKLSFIFILLLIFIVNTYAWMSQDRNVQGGAFTANVSAWGVEFVIADEDIKVEEYTYEIEEFHPGIDPIQKDIHIYNVGEGDSDIYYTISDIYLYGQRLQRELIENDEYAVETLGTPVTNADGSKTIDAFGNEDATIFDTENDYGFSLRYETPFTISYTYDKIFIEGNDGSDASTANFSLNLAWYNDEANNEEDTKLGNMAYDYKISNPDEPALKIVVKVIARRADV